MQEITEQARRHYREAAATRDPDEVPWIERQRIHTPRDSYGWRNMPRRNQLGNKGKK